MSMKLFGIVIEDLNKGLAPADKLILAALAGSADHEGRGVMPPRRALAEIALCSINEVRKIVDRCVERGVLLIDGPGSAWGRSRRFRIDIARALELHAGDPQPTAPVAQAPRNAQPLSRQPPRPPLPISPYALA